MYNPSYSRSTQQNDKFKIRQFSFRDLINVLNQNTNVVVSEVSYNRSNIVYEGPISEYVDGFKGTFYEHKVKSLDTFGNKLNIKLVK